MPQRHLGVDGMTAGNTEDLQICVVAVAFGHLRGRCISSAVTAAKGAEGVSYLLVLLDLLQFGVGDDAFQLVETFLHHGEPQSGRLLLPSDPFQLPSTHLLCDARALLPLLDPLRQDLIDTTEKVTKTIT